MAWNRSDMFKNPSYGSSGGGQGGMNNFFNNPDFSGGGITGSDLDWESSFKGGKSFFDKGGPKAKGLGTWDKVAIGADVGGTIANAWFGLQGLDLAKDQFGLAKDTANTNIAAQSKTLAADLEGKYYAQARRNGMSHEEAQANSASRINSMNLPTNVTGKSLRWGT